MNDFHKVFHNWSLIIVYPSNWFLGEFDLFPCFSDCHCMDFPQIYISSLVLALSCFTLVYSLTYWAFLLGSSRGTLNLASRESNLSSASCSQPHFPPPPGLFSATVNGTTIQAKHQGVVLDSSFSYNHFFQRILNICKFCLLLISFVPPSFSKFFSNSRAAHHDLSHGFIHRTPNQLSLF